jgi:hypothetical protein
MALLDLLIGPVLQIANKLIPDPAQQAQFQIQLLQLQQTSEFQELNAQLQMAQTQTNTNNTEASNANLFVAGWRPFIGWICGSGLAWNFAGVPLINAVMTIIGHPVNIPVADLSEMMPLLIGMLGLGGMRTYEKINGVNSGQ